MRGQAVVFGLPTLTAVARAVNAPAEPSHIQHARLGRAAGVEQNVGRRGLRQPVGLRVPARAAVVAAHHAALVGRGRGAPPHLRARQVVGAGHHRPDASPHSGVEDQPVGGVEPPARHAIRRCAGPTRAAVVRRKQADVGVADEHMPRVERIEVHAVIRGHVQPRRGPAAARHPPRIGRLPGRPAVQRAQRPPIIGSIADLRLLGRDAEPVRIFTPIGTEALAQPPVVHGRRLLARLAPDVVPGRAEVIRPGDAERLCQQLASPAEARVGHVGVEQRSRHGPQLPARRLARPRRAAVPGHVRRSARNSVDHRFPALSGEPRRGVQKRFGGHRAQPRRRALHDGHPVPAYHVNRALPGRGSGVDVDVRGARRHLGGHARPRPPPIGRAPQRQLALGGENGVQRLRVLRIHGQGGDRLPALRKPEFRFGMVVGHGDAGDRLRTGVNQGPGRARVRAAPQTLVLDVERVGVGRVEDEELRHAAQVDHTPALSAILGQVRAGHVATDEHHIRVQRADGGMELRAAAAGTDHLPGIVAGIGRRGAGRGRRSRRGEARQNQAGGERRDEFHGGTSGECFSCISPRSEGQCGHSAAASRTVAPPFSPLAEDRRRTVLEWSGVRAGTLPAIRAFPPPGGWRCGCRCRFVFPCWC